MLEKGQKKEKNFFQSIIARDTRSLKRMLKHGIRTNYFTLDGHSPLVIAAMQGDDKIIKILFDYDYSADPKDMKLALDYALKYSNNDSEFKHYQNYDKTIALLINYGADLNFEDKRGQTPLHKYSKKNAKILIENGADVNAKDLYGRTPISIAAENGDKYVVKILIENDADVNAADLFGKTPLMYAASQDNIEVFQELLENDADINAKDINGKDALLYYAESSKNAYEDEFTKLFIENGAKTSKVSGLSQKAQIYLKKYEDSLELLNLDKKLKSLDIKEKKEKDKEKE